MRHPAWLVETVRLALVPGVGPRLRQALLERFGDPAGVLAAGEAELRGVAGIGPKIAQRVAAARDEIDAEAELDLCARRQVGVLAEADDAYPRALREIHDPPGVLFLRGALAPQDALSVAIVGTRHATAYGRKHAERLAASLARAGLTVTSGLARGIDAAAHRGALAAGGRTLAVLGSGVLNVYPPEHDELARQVIDDGALLSESPPRGRPLSGSFPQRNRIISGLSLGVIVVEAAERSGALITARHAMEQGREVFAVPGPVDSRMSRGCHRLLRDGAKLVESADDVLEELGPLAAPAEGAEGRTIHHPAELQLNELERRVLDAVAATPTAIDALAAETGLPIHQVLSAVSVLEMRRLIRRVGGQHLLRS